jgi:hypothetical protein
VVPDRHVPELDVRHVDRQQPADDDDLVRSRPEDDVRRVDVASGSLHQRIASPS